MRNSLQGAALGLWEFTTLPALSVSTSVLPPPGLSCGWFGIKALLELIAQTRVSGHFPSWPRLTCRLVYEEQWPVASTTAGKPSGVCLPVGSAQCAVEGPLRAGQAGITAVSLLALGKGQAGSCGDPDSVHGPQLVRGAPARLPVALGLGHSRAVPLPILFFVGLPLQVTEVGGET